MALDPAALLLTAKHQAKKTAPPQPSSRMFSPIAKVLGNMVKRAAKAPALPAAAGPIANTTPAAPRSRDNSREVMSAQARIAVTGQRADPPQRAPSCTSDYREAVAAERARCARIIAHGINIGAAEQAGVLAFDTDMTAVTAIKALDAAKTDRSEERRSGLRGRMSQVRTAPPAASVIDATALADQIVAAGRKARGELY